MIVLGLVLSTAASALLLVVMFVPLERAFPARPGQPVLRPRVAVDACFFFGQYLLFSAVAAFILGGAHRALKSLVPGEVPTFAHTLPTWALAIVAIALGDLAMYAFHRACHRFELLWRFHAVHHTAEHLDWVAAHREHPLDGILTQLAMNLPAMVLGLPYEGVGALIVLRGVWAVFIHSNVRLDVGPLRYLLGAPELHHWHHAKVRETRHNFANLAPWVDLLFGTYHRPEGPERFALGIPDDHPRDYLGLLAWPFRRKRAVSFPATNVDPSEHDRPLGAAR
jgi:sterol desaturase/sphingolipid hydroxylase (fatty acid hydroxylase superfamily)